MFVALLCAIWTAAYVVRANWRVRSLRLGRGYSTFSLVVRTLFFSVFIGVALM